MTEIPSTKPKQEDAYIVEGYLIEQTILGSQGVLSIKCQSNSQFVSAYAVGKRGVEKELLLHQLGFGDDVSIGH